MIPKLKIEALEIVLPSENGRDSVVENKLSALYRNQRRIYHLLGNLAEFLGVSIEIESPSILKSEKGEK